MVAENAVEGLDLGGAGLCGGRTDDHPVNGPGGARACEDRARMISRIRSAPVWQFFGVLARADRRLAIAWWALVVLRSALLAASAAFKAGETSTAKLRRLLLKTIATAPLARFDYAEIADADTLRPVREVRRGTVFALAVFFGKTRLIDNIVLG